ncbi:PEBP family protein [Haloterrigena turkmenica DSM 5511]|uniref:PEBP family protein n=1 Tax=Haloterrigena turkmenica (strain ATCC 51198 / DSM 5511 / JCM 9101 / NCIMB 13204 / VKM B-1734 / 4k) TaxID=543526 RepID=D2RV60_HALTV|nr:YbhB/YbcL family Raf kinase inhibitor-like protein [Haloterrigena turkmenica]ADB61261.1 PEBP family protein [Haloterrigena turkmenica DSM 5511]
MATLTLTSPEFDDGERIPDRYGYEAANVNPPLEIDGVPDDAETLALIVDDPDAVEPAGKVWDHWLVWNVPAEETTIPVDWNPDDAGAEEGTNDYGEPGYGGPNPPDREHTYRFTVFAVADAIDPGTDPDADDLRDAMEGRTVAKATLEGTYPA